MDDVLEIKKKIKLLKNDIISLSEKKEMIISDESYSPEEKQSLLISIQQKIEKKESEFRELDLKRQSLEKETNILLMDIVKRKALESLNGIVTPERINYYKKLLNNSNNIDEIKSVVDSINDIVRQDYINNITKVDSFNPNMKYRFICHSISLTEFNVDDGYDGNFVSCSLLSNEQNDTYSSNVGLIYSPTEIVAASSGDCATNNKANTIDDVLLTQKYPTIQNINSIIKETIEKQKLNNSNTYNEIVVKNSRPIGIFYKGDYEELDEFQKNILKKLQGKYPDLKMISIPLKTYQDNMDLNNTGLHHPKASELNELEKQKQMAKQNNDTDAYNYYQNAIVKLIRENRMQVKPEQWDSFDNNQKMDYIRIKMRESKVLNDKDEFNFG